MSLRSAVWAVIIAGTVHGTFACSDTEDQGPSDTGGTSGASGHGSAGRSGESSSGGDSGEAGATGHAGTDSLPQAGSAGDSGGTSGSSGTSGSGGTSGGSRPTGEAGDDGGDAGGGGAPDGRGGGAGAGGSGAASGAPGTGGSGGSTSTGGTMSGASGAGGAGAAGASGTSGAGGASGAGATSGSSGTAGSGAGGTAGGAATGGTSAAGEGGEGGAEPTLPEKILEYDFEETTGSEVLDLSGSGNHGSLVDSAFTTDGRNGGAGLLASSTSHVALPDGLLAGSHELTVAAWVYLTADEPFNRLFDLGTGTSTHLAFTLRNDTAGLSLISKLNGTERTLSANSRLPLNVWKHVAVTLSGSGAFLFVDGREIARSTTLIVDPDDFGITTRNWIGRSQYGDAAFQGRIDEFKMYRRALARSEIAQLAWPKTDYSIWHFDEGSGTTVADSSDNHRDGTLVNAGFGPGSSAISGGSLRLANPTDTTTPATPQYVSLPPGVAAACTDGFTFAGFIAQEVKYTFTRIFDFGNGATDYFFMSTRGGLTDHLALLRRRPADAARTVVVSYNVPPTPNGWGIGIWYHVAVTRNADVARMYVNGSEIVPTVVNGAFDVPSTLGNTQNNYFGRPQADGAGTVENARHFSGLMDEFLMSCRGFSADEIKQLAYRP